MTTPSKKGTSAKSAERPGKGPPLPISGEHFKLVPNGAALAIVKAAPGERRECSGDVLTRAQLEQMLWRHSIPTVPGPALSGYLSSLHSLPAFERHAPGAFSLNPGSTTLSRSDWRGNLGERSAQHGGMFPQQDLNAVRPNHPIFDLRDHRGRLSSVKTSVRSADSRGDPFETYLRGLRDIVGLRPSTWERARAALYPQLPADEGRAQMLRNGLLLVNEDHVEPFRAALRDPDNYRKQSYREVADKLLEMEPVRMGGTVYRAYQNLENTRRGPGTPAEVRRRAEVSLSSLREKIASHVGSNSLTTPHLVQLERFRHQVAAANPHMTPAQINRWVFPELLLVARHGGGVRGNAVASGIAAGRGAAGGAVVSLICEAGHAFYESRAYPDEQQPEAVPRALRAGATGGTSGLVGGATQNLVMANAGSAMSRNLIARGANVRVAAGTGRAMGGFAGGALAAPVFTMTALALDDEEHSGTDYAATGTRAFVAGGLSSAIAAGLVGAIWGSEVPLLGNAVGFIIGFGGYYLVDALTGEQVEQGVRRSLDGPTPRGR
ncbi:hypothetical protein [Archangium violaceum]|uniref:Uncharacterized protein n=1 Tax=Archangium violaceum Cb vi76 TaxID=1406225 RepID=A0A084SFR2_9BACT|nr:hypothetical protein [Archangium violaceum]KFA87297.1 hypothetical protein Q664_48525 [Archangium violaceum Cb vi76]